jgi:hypothetical protein
MHSDVRGFVSIFAIEGLLYFILFYFLLMVILNIYSFIFYKIGQNFQKFIMNFIKWFKLNFLKILKLFTPILPWSITNIYFLTYL